MNTINYPKIHNDANTEFSVYNECVNHCKKYEDYLVRGSLSTSSHEINHKISSDLRMMKNSYSFFVSPEDEDIIINENLQPKESMRGRSFGSGKRNGFYLGNDIAILLEEPNIRKSQVAEFILPQFRKSRFNTYITGQTAWDDTPLYICDEWNAYIWGTECAVELGKKGNQQNKGTDISMGPIEFMIYVLGMCLTIKKYDPDYLDENFMEFINFQVERSMKSVNECLKYFDWAETRQLLVEFDSPEATIYKDLLSKERLTRDDFNIV
jgi:hypothetical protein